MPLYTIRPLYILLVAALGAVTHNDITATYGVSAISTALAVLVSFLLAGRMGVTGAWRIAVPLIWVANLGPNLASLSTPDGLETLLCLSFVFVWFYASRSVARIAVLVVLAALMVATRTDAVLLLLALAAAEFTLSRDSRLSASIVGIAALLTYWLIQRFSGNYGYIAVLNFQLIEDRAHSVIPNATLNLSGYLVALRGAIAQILGRDSQGSLLTTALAVLVFACIREYGASTVSRPHHTSRAMILAIALIAYLVGRFALFPAPVARYMAGAYVLAGLLFVRCIQQLATGRPGPVSPADAARAD